MAMLSVSAIAVRMQLVFRFGLVIDKSSSKHELAGCSFAVFISNIAI